MDATNKNEVGNKETKYSLEYNQTCNMSILNGILHNDNIEKTNNPSLTWLVYVSALTKFLKIKLLVGATG
jgi:hypothetical protein